MTFHGYELITEWKNSQCGQTACAQRNGKKYFLKKYQTPVKPVRNGALDERTFRKNEAAFDAFVSLHGRLNGTLRAISGAGGNIVIPCEEFVEDNHYVEVAELVDGVVPDDDIRALIASLPADQIKLLMLTAAGALASVHGKGIIHSDLKLKNVLIAKNPSGNYVAKLIDFDSSYFTDEKPEEITGDIAYYSPELGRYADAEDEREELADTLTVKSDIFSLGLIYHVYLSGEMPAARSLTPFLQKWKNKGKTIYSWVVINSGCELKVSDRIRDFRTRALIYDMLEADPARRPAAMQVLRRMKTAEDPREESAPWPEHGIAIDAAKLAAAGYVSLVRRESGGAKGYFLREKDGRGREKTCDELLEEGIAKKAREERFDDPWEEIPVSLYEEKLRARGFVASERKELSGAKGYDFFRADGSSVFFTAEKLISMGYAAAGARPCVSGTICDPWPEQAIVFDGSRIRERGYAGIERQEMSGVKGYKLIRADGSAQFIKAETLLVLKMASRT